MTDDARNTKITVIHNELGRVLRRTVATKLATTPAPTEDPMPRPFQDLPPQTEVSHRSVSIPARSKSPGKASQIICNIPSVDV